MTPAQASSPTTPTPTSSPSGTALGHAFLSDNPGTSSGATPGASGTPTLPAGFTSTVVLSGLTNPTKVRFASDGSVWVIEKTGVILRYAGISSPTPTVFADLSSEVNSYWDRGMMGLALAPNFPTDPSIYVLYTYDHNPVSDYMPSAPTAWNDNCPSPPGPLTDGCPVLGRLTKLTATAGGATWSGAKTTVVQGWCQQGPSHSMDDLNFGPDGYLYVSAGEGDMFVGGDYGQFGGSSVPVVTPTNPCGDPPTAPGTTLTSPTSEGGALRSQSPRRTDGPAILSGTLLRIDPSTGLGVAGNPFASSSDVNAKRILAYGLRNPFRFTFRPGHPDQVWLGDVGNSTWEEINKIPVPSGGSSIPTTGNNFGWPCYEGNDTGLTYGSTPFNICDSLVSAGTAIGPYYTYNHSANINATESCRIGSSSISALGFYTGTSYPPAYRGALFFGDHSRDCIWAMLPDGSGNPDPTNIVPVVTGSPTASTYWVGPVDLESGPNGDLYYVSLDQGTVNRISYGVPSAAVSSDVTNGAAPLTVHLNGSTSVDPAGGGLSYSWTVPGGACDSLTSATPTCVFSIGTWNVRLTVTDINLATNTSPPYTITAGDTPPIPVIDTIDGAAPPTQPSGPLPPPGVRPNGVPAFWRVGDLVTFAGHAADAQDGTEPASRLSWQLVMHHCPSDCHLHFLQNWTAAASGSFSAPDHPYPSYLEVILTATDANGLTASTSVYLYPKTATLHLASSPAGIVLTIGGGTPLTAPGNATFMENGSAQLAAPATQAVAGKTYRFWKWSDGGTATHNVTAHDGTTYTADYLLSGAPAASISADVASGPAPLTVRLNGTASSDPAGHGLTYAWTVPGGVCDSLTSATPRCVFPVGTWSVRLKVTDITSVSNTSAAFTITAADTPPVPVIDTIDGAAPPAQPTGTLPPPALRPAGVPAFWSVGETIAFTGHAADAQDGTEPATRLSWQVIVHDCHSGCRLQSLKTFAGATLGSFGAPGPAYPSYLEIVLTATDANGQSAHRSIYLYPKTATLHLHSSPAGIVLTVGGTAVTAPGDVTFIANGSAGLSAPLTQTIGGNTYMFWSWSDGAAETHSVTAHDGATYNATYVLEGATYHSLSPARVADSRVSKGVTTLATGVPQSFAVWGKGGVPLGAVAVTGNVTVVKPSFGGFVTVSPVSSSTPGTSTVNFPTGVTTANGVTVALSASGKLSVVYEASRAGATTGFLFDVTGYYR